MSDATAGSGTASNAAPRAALLRAGIAVAAAVALMAAVLLVDDARPLAPSPPASPQPGSTPPADAAKPPAVVPALDEGQRIEASKAEAAQGEAAGIDRTPAPPPAVQTVPEAPVPPAMPKAPAPVAAVPPAPPAAGAAGPAPAHVAALAALANQPAAPMKDGYLLQLGVFGNPVNAGALQAELAARGLPARVESRVVLGPFPDRKALEAAQRRLKREQGRDAVVVPPRKGR